MATFPLPVFHFLVNLGGLEMACTEVSGLDVETQVIEFRSGNSPDYITQKIPGMPKTANISIKHGIFPANNDFFNWWNTVKLNTIERRDVTISLLNENHEPVVVWKVKDAWPTKIQSPTLKADGNEIAIETMELVHEGITIQND